ncbi:unnamed protein product [Polarella glacialis]|uniref:Uncharacterized protein n=1 Tax=Polarella glacialis TaxID=89957 RepID=A0A813J3N1_POLGL|nr:unnamed protein product [Polarella glacialis]
MPRIGLLLLAMDSVAGIMTCMEWVNTGPCQQWVSSCVGQTEINLYSASGRVLNLTCLAILCLTRLLTSEAPICYRADGCARTCYSTPNCSSFSQWCSSAETRHAAGIPAVTGVMSTLLDQISQEEEVLEHSSAAPVLSTTNLLTRQVEPFDFTGVVEAANVSKAAVLTKARMQSEVANSRTKVAGLLFLAAGLLFLATWIIGVVLVWTKSSHSRSANVDEGALLQ